jgi:hypothetical protein
MKTDKICIIVFYWKKVAVDCEGIFVRGNTRPHGAKLLDTWYNVEM